MTCNILDLSLHSKPQTFAPTTPSPQTGGAFLTGLRLVNIDRKSVELVVQLPDTRGHLTGTLVLPPTSYGAVLD